MYAFLTLEIVNLFLITFSRGQALTAATVSTAVAVAGWLLWSGAAPEDGVTIGPALVLLGGIAYSVIVGLTTAIPTARSRGTYLVALIATIFGLWWTMAVSLEGGLPYSALLDVAIAVGTIVPLAFVLGAIGSGPNTIASYLVAISAYLSMTQVVVTGLTYIFTTVLPKTLDIQRPEVGEPPWLVLLRWKAAISSIGLIVAVAFMLGVSVSYVAKHFEATNYPFLQRQIAATVERQNSTTASLTKLTTQIARTAMTLARTIYLVAVFMAQCAKEFGSRVWAVVLRVGKATWNAVRFFLAPIVALGAGGVLLLAAVRDVDFYSQGALHAYSPTAIWAGVICVTALIIGLAGVAFAFAPLTPNYERLSLNGTGPAIMLAAAFWGLISLGSIMLLPAWHSLRSLNIDAPSISMGPVLWSNFLVVSALAVVFTVIGIVLGASSKTLAPKVFTTVLIAFLAAFSVASVVLGWRPFTAWVGNLFV